MFKKYDEINNKKIDLLSKEIENAKLKIEKINNKLKSCENADEFMELSCKVSGYENFIKFNQQKIVEIKNRPYSEEEIQSIKKEIIKTFNPKLQKQFNNLKVAIADISKIYNEYKRLDDEFIKCRNEFNVKSQRGGINTTLYYENGIKNLYAKQFEKIINDLNRALNQCK